MAVAVPKTDAQIAELAPVQSVAGMTGTVSLTYEDIVGIGSMAVQSASSVSISGGTVSGITDLAVADGGTGASNASGARTNLGLVIGTDVLAPTGSGASLTGITQSQVAGLTTALADKADLVGGVIPSSQIPSVAITEFLGAVASEVAMTALSGQEGDWCIRTDSQMAYFLVGSDPTNAANWTAIPHPSSPVLTVNGQTGAVVLGASDVNAQASDATLTALAGVSTAANKLIYATGSDTFSTTDFTSAARSLLDDADASAMRTTLGLGNVTNNAQTQAAIVPNTAPTAGQLLVGNAGGTAYGVVSASGDATISSTGVITLANGSGTRTNLGLGSIATQAANSVTITGGSVTNITDIAVADGGTGASTAAAARTNLGVATSNNNWFDSAPAVGTITWVAKSRVAFTINGVYGVKTTAGTCTFAVKINGTAVTGLSAVSVTTSTQDVAATAANSVAIGDAVTIEYTAASSPANLSFTLEATR